MGRVPTRGEMATRFTDRFAERLAALGDEVDEDRRQLAHLQARVVRGYLVQVVGALAGTSLPVAEALATVLVDLGREIAPPAPAVDPREHALARARNRNTGPPPVRRRAPRSLGPHPTDGRRW